MRFSLAPYQLNLNLRKQVLLQMNNSIGIVHSNAHNRVWYLHVYNEINL